MKPVTAVISVILALCSLPTPAAPGSGDFLAREDVRSFIETMRDEHGIEIADPACVAKTFPGYWDVLDGLRDTP